MSQIAKRIVAYGTDNGVKRIYSIFADKGYSGIKRLGASIFYLK